MAKLTEAEMIARYDAERSGAAWLPVLEITDDPTNDGQLHDDDDDDDEAGDEADERGYQPVPPVPAGYPTDRAFIYQHFGDMFVTIDRRDGEMAICTTGIAGDDHIILPPAFVLALAQFLNQADIRELVGYLRGKAERAN